jgi:hypothetical protein
MASAPSPPSPCYSSTSCSSVIAPGNGRPTSRPPIASSSASPRRKPGPKGPSAELIAAIIALKYRNPHFGCVRIAQAKDSLWSVDLFRCESILLHSHWVLVVIDVFTRRIIGFGIERGSIDGVSVCRMFNHAVNRVVFWNAADLARKLEAFRDCYNGHRVHRALTGLTPAQRAGALCPAPAALDHYGCQQHCRGLFELPIAA